MRQVTRWQRLLAIFSSPNQETGGDERDEKTPLPFELDVQKLNLIQYRHQILDWRDDFSAQMLAEGKDLFWKFCEHSGNEADKVGILRKLVAKPAAKVLKDDFFKLIRSPLAERVRSAEAQLGKIIESQPPARFPPLNFSVEEVDPSLVCLRGLRFRPSNQDKIRTNLHLLVFGERGVIDCYLQRARTIAASLLQAMAK